MHEDERQNLEKRDQNVVTLTLLYGGEQVVIFLQMALHNPVRLVR